MKKNANKPPRKIKAPAPAGKLQPLVGSIPIFVTDKEEADIILALRAIIKLGIGKKNKSDEINNIEFLKKDNERLRIALRKILQNQHISSDGLIFRIAEEALSNAKVRLHSPKGNAHE